MYSLIIYRVLTYPYMRLVRVADGGIVVAASGAVSKTTSWATSYTTLTKVTLIGGIPVTIPAAMPPGEYDMLIYDATSPAASDTIEIGKRIAWSGTQILGHPLDI